MRCGGGTDGTFLGGTHFGSDKWTVCLSVVSFMWVGGEDSGVGVWGVGIGPQRNFASTTIQWFVGACSNENASCSYIS